MSTEKEQRIADGARVAYVLRVRGPGKVMEDRLIQGVVTGFGRSYYRVTVEARPPFTLSRDYWPRRVKLERENPDAPRVEVA